MKKVGIPIGKAFKLAKDGRTPVRDERRLDLCTQIKRKSAPKKRYSGRKPDAFRV